MKKPAIIIIGLFLTLHGSLFSQTITLTSALPPVDGTVCPQIPNTYSVDVPAGCTVVWNVTNGTKNTPDGPTMSVTWDDKPGATATISVTFSGCNNSNDNKLTATWSALILSVKDQAVPTYYNSLNVDYCAKGQSVHIQIPHVYVQGTGGIGEPPLQEVLYLWTLPSGWTFTNGSSASTTLNTIDIAPINCALPGNVLVKGAVGLGCPSAGFTSTSTITLNGASPTLTMGPQAGYTGAIFGQTTPVTFTANLAPALQCVTGYTWNFPSGWTYNGSSSTAITASNTITLTPSGTNADAGSIYVSANVTCGSLISTIPYVVNYTPPHVSGPGLICTSGNFTVQNVAPGVSYSWSSGNTAGLSVSPTSVNSATGTFNSVPGFTGSVPVNVSLSFGSNSISASATPYVGMPAADNSTLIYVAGSRGTSSYTLNPLATYYFQCDPVLGATTYNWVLPSGFSFLSGNGGMSTYITTSGVNGNYSLYCQAMNGCGGSYTHNLTISIVGGTGGTGDTGGGSGGGSGGGGVIKKPCCPITAIATVPFKFKMYPNPSIHSFIVNVMDTTANENPITDYEVHLFDQTSKEVFYLRANTAETHIPVDNLPPNIYYLVIQSKEGVLKEELLIKR